MAHPGHYDSPMQLSPQEQCVVEAVAARADALVALTSELVAFDTVTHMAGAPPREERLTPRGGQQVFGVRVVLIDRQHLTHDRGRHPITTVDRRHCPIHQLIDRRTTFDGAHSPSYPQPGQKIIPPNGRQTRRKGAGTDADFLTN
jgi:hypothetical protein